MTLRAMIGHPSLYQINTRVAVTRLSRVLGREATLDDIPDCLLDRLAERRMDWVWLLGVWQTGLAGRNVALTEPALREEYRRALPDVRDSDIRGSCFAVTVPAQALTSRLHWPTLLLAVAFGGALFAFTRWFWGFGLRHYSGASA